MTDKETRPTEWAEWARVHRVCYEIEPLKEMHEGRSVQVGFRVHLLAALPTDAPPGPERMERARQVLARLHDLAGNLSPSDGGGARVQIDPPRTEAVLRPDNALQPELRLSLRLVHAHDYFASVTDAERSAVGNLDSWFAERGVRKGRW